MEQLLWPKTEYQHTNMAYYKYVFNVCTISVEIFVAIDTHNYLLSFNTNVERDLLRSNNNNGHS